MRNIALLEPSLIVYEGFSNILSKAKIRAALHWFTDFDDLLCLLEKSEVDVVLMNPCTVQNRIAEFLKCKKHHPSVSWIGIVYSYYDNVLLCHYSDILSMNDSAETIVRVVNNSLSGNNCDDLKEPLSQREIEVLKQLIDGLSNKEIADILNISTHTVVSHRKKIMEKTGIKSLPGLTIFAISQKIISINAIHQ
jgi:DNA-binding NarL/FixJ family response regulator